MRGLVCLLNGNFKQHSNIQVRFLNFNMKQVENTVHCFMYSETHQWSIGTYNSQDFNSDILSLGNTGDSLV